MLCTWTCNVLLLPCFCFMFTCTMYRHVMFFYYHVFFFMFTCRMYNELIAVNMLVNMYMLHMHVSRLLIYFRPCLSMEAVTSLQPFQMISKLNISSCNCYLVAGMELPNGLDSLPSSSVYIAW